MFYPLQTSFKIWLLSFQLLFLSWLVVFINSLKISYLYTMYLKYIYFCIPTSSGPWTPPIYLLLNFIFFEISAVHMNTGTGASTGARAVYQWLCSWRQVTSSSISSHAVTAPLLAVGPPQLSPSIGYLDFNWLGLPKDLHK